MKALYDVPAPAKLNLFLHITGRRPDGYHLLQSVFMLVDWCDTLHFELRSDGHISREDLGPALPVDDLTVRAARALQAFSAAPLGVHMGVQKRIPAQAGMGGGSSDAASCLLALNRLWNLQLSLSKLERIGLQLGADVPFFLRGHNAWVQGIGEKITPLEGEFRLPAARFVVLKPRAGLETRLIFAANDLKRDTETAIISGFAADPFGFGQNNLQPVAQRLCPEVTQALEWLAAQGLQGRMTGSGSAVFAQMRHETDLTRLAQVPTGWKVRTCSNLDVHPLVGWAASDD
ncbi:MAG: 4-(cytidine 5'-diphospho)-2-C-methyl-D-erythritol kinase [Rhodoferax sp.]|nr:4-(cytidine 5'-diphospho)-2-C-methyl-D-erythritol kinase [Rhodoferax sp.]